MLKAMKINQKEDRSRVDIEMKTIHSAKDALFATNQPVVQLKKVKKNEEMRDDNM